MSWSEMIGEIYTTIKITGRILELQKSYVEAKDMPEAFTEVLDRLPLVRSCLILSLTHPSPDREIQLAHLSPPTTP